MSVQDKEEEEENSEEMFLASRNRKRGTGSRGLGIKRTREEMFDEMLTERIYDAIANVFDKTTWSLTKVVKRSVMELIEEEELEIK